jgi:hypothetical protein
VKGAADMERLTFRCLTGRDGRCPDLGAESQGPGTDGLRWEQTWRDGGRCFETGASRLILSGGIQSVVITRMHIHM